MNSSLVSRKTVNKNQIIHVWNVYRTDHTVANCVYILKNYVSMSCKLLDSKLTSAIDAERLLNDAFDWLYCIGLVPIVYNKDIMYIPAPEHVTLYVLAGKHSISYECELNDSRSFFGMGQDRQQIFLWNGGLNLPTIDGDLCSIMYKICLKQDVLDLIQERAYVSMYLATNPILVSQAVKKTNSDVVGTNWVHTGDYGPTNDDNGSLEYQHKMEVHKSINKARHLIHAERARLWGTDAERSSKWKHLSEELNLREYFVPDDRELARREMPHVCWQEYQTERLYYENLIYDLFSIPASLRVVSQTSRNNANGKGNAISGHLEEQSFNKCVTRLRSRLEEFLESVIELYCSFGKLSKLQMSHNDTDKDTDRTTDKDNNKDTDKDTDKDRRPVQEDINTKPLKRSKHVKIDSCFLISSDETLQLCQNNIITPEECIVSIRQSMGMNVDNIGHLVKQLQARQEHERKQLELQEQSEQQQIKVQKQQIKTQEQQVRTQQQQVKTQQQQVLNDKVENKLKLQSDQGTKVK